MLEAFVNLIPLAIGLVVGIVWIISIAKWDGKCHCDTTQCDSCPYCNMCEYNPKFKNSKEEKK